MPREARANPYTPEVDLATALARCGEAVTARLDALLAPVPGARGRVIEAMRYSALSGGKRLRPFLVLESAGLFDVDAQHALQTAAAVEMVHCYSLIHDDLPAMDDSDLRRGNPTLHKKFDEATAILAGDGLLTEAFAVPEIGIYALWKGVLFVTILFLGLVAVWVKGDLDWVMSYDGPEYVPTAERSTRVVPSVDEILKARGEGPEDADGDDSTDDPDGSEGEAAA